MDRGAVRKSILRLWNGFSGGGERAIRRSIPAIPGSDCWASEKYSEDCHESGGLSFWMGMICAFCRECWFFSDFTVFCLRKEERK